MNKLTLWLAKTQLPKISRYLLAALGAYLAKIGFEGDQTNFAELLGGLAAFGFAALWSVAHKIEGFNWIDKFLNAIGGEGSLKLWVEALSKKGIAALFVWLGTRGVQVDETTTTEGVIGILLTLVLSHLATPDKVKKGGVLLLLLSSSVLLSSCDTLFSPKPATSTTTVTQKEANGAVSTTTTTAPLPAPIDPFDAASGEAVRNLFPAAH